MSSITIDIMVLLCLMVTATVTGSDFSQCSCYMFYGNSSNWDISKSLCKSTGGELISIETEEEWTYVNNQIQTKSTETGANQWWIGLHRENGYQWVWMSGSNITYDKWKPMKIDRRNQDSYIYGVIDKADGTFMKTKKSTDSGKICEYKRKDCTTYHSRWCSYKIPSTTTSPPPPTDQFTDQRKITTTTTVTTTQQTKITAHKPTTQNKIDNGTVVLQPLPTGNQEKKERSVQSKKKPFPIVILVVVLVIILLVCIGILIVVWIHKSRKTGGRRITQRRKSLDNKLDASLDVRNMYDQYSEDFSDHGNAMHHGKLTTNGVAHEQIEMNAAHQETSKATNEQNGRSLSVKGNVMGDTIQNEPLEEEKQKIQEESTDTNRKRDGESNTKHTTFMQKIEEEDDVFYTEPEEDGCLNLPEEDGCLNLPEEDGCLNLPEEDGCLNLTEEDGCVNSPEEDGCVNSPEEDGYVNLSEENSSEIFTYATISETDNKEPSTEVLYAEVNDASDETDKEEDITYAEIAEFTANSTEPIKKPTPYYPTEYASVTVHPLSPRFDT